MKIWAVGCGLGWTVLKKVWADYEQLLREVFLTFLFAFILCNFSGRTLKYFLKKIQNRPQNLLIIGHVHSPVQTTAHSPESIFHIIKSRDQTSVLLSVISTGCRKTCFDSLSNHGKKQTLCCDSIFEHGRTTKIISLAFASSCFSEKNNYN